MWFEIAVGTFLLGQFIYHRWIEDKDQSKPRTEIEVPKFEEGAVYPIVYGRCRIDSPVLAWIGTPHTANFNSLGVITYCVSMYYLIGIPFLNGTNRLHAIWASDMLMQRGAALTSTVDLSDLSGAAIDDDPPPEGIAAVYGFQIFEDTNEMIGGRVEFLNGNDAQVLVSGSTPLTRVAKHMAHSETGSVSLADIPGYRGHMSAFLYNPFVVGLGGDFGYLDPPASLLGFGWSIGASPAVPSMSFEVSSYPEGTGLAGNRQINLEANPADVIYDILTGELKLAIPHARVDITSFTSVAQTLLSEEHGYSMALDTAQDAREIIGDILKQIDGVIYEDPADMLIKIKLVRGDYNPATLLNLNPTNTRALEQVALGGWTNVVNKVRVVYRDRQFNYKENSAVAHNMANAVGQDGQVREVVLQMPGVCTAALAETIAERELTARSRPIMKCRAIVGRAFRGINPGDVVTVTWPRANVSNVLFRVAQVNRGTLENGDISLDLIQDFNYQHRGSLQVAGGLNVFPGTVELAP